MGAKMLTALKWIAIALVVLIYVVWAFSSEHESYPHAAIGVLVFIFWWEMRGRLDRVQQSLDEANQRLRSLTPHL
jgi:cbb3-type cytochrome oxidase subunit 3